ncbi:alpha-L-arabinofuranosidase [Streptomyces albospinus]|uniref:Alpha-L-arabinofuranosidase n=1 Tax=Streptomyces albospinus TaxID=285515 RepID=A0ABQ2VLI7_9ACTN|nr:alpha-L-arabinofuranosidase [Streptomyces albospinus]
MKGPHTVSPRNRSRVFALAAATAVLAGTAAAPSATALVAEPSGPTSAADIKVTNRVTNTLSSHAIGVNTPFWNPYLTRPDTPELIRKAGISTLSFNAGGPGDLYHFQNGGWLSPDPNGKNNGGYEDLDPTFTFDQFAKTAQDAHAGMLVHVNYGTGPTDTKAHPSTTEHPKPGDPREAAAWVRYANRTHHYDVHDWVVGEETYLNGWFSNPKYPAPKEPDAHTDKSPTAYARNSIAYAKAMKAVDPSIRVGIEFFPNDPATAHDPGKSKLKEWDDAVLNTPGLAKAVDFVDIHWYHPTFSGKFDDASVLADTARTAPVLKALRASLDQASGPRHHIDIVAGESNSGVFPTQQQDNAVGALYLLDSNLSLLESGVSDVDWWALYNGPSSTKDGGWGDLGLLSSGKCPWDQPKKKHCEPPVGTPFAPYNTLRMLTTALKGGGATLATTTTGGSGTLTTHAVRRADGTLAVVVVNKDPKQTQSFHLSLPAGYHTDRTLTWQRGDSTPTTHRGAAPTSLAPYSAAVILLNR